MFGEEFIVAPGNALEGGEVFGGADIAEDDADVAFPALETRTAERGAGKGLAEGLLVPGEHGAEIGVIAGGEFGFAGLPCPAIPWADVEAIVAAEEVIAEGAAVFEGKAAAVLDREVAQASAGVQLVGPGDGPGRAGIDTARAGAAAVALGFVGGQVQGTQDDAEEEPLALLPVDDEGVFRLPADAGEGGERFFENGAGIHVGLLPATPVTHRGTKPLQLFEEEFVVIASEGVFRDAAAPRWFLLKIVVAEDDDRPGFREYLARILPFLHAALHPRHRAVFSLGNPLAKVLRAQGGGKRDDTESVGSVFAGLPGERGLLLGGVHSGVRNKCFGPAGKDFAGRRAMCLRDHCHLGGGP